MVEGIPTSKQTVNLLKETLFEIKLRADKIATVEANAFAADKNDKKRSNSTKVNSSKKKKKELIAKKRNFLATRAKTSLLGCGVSSKTSACLGQSW